MRTYICEDMKKYEEFLSSHERCNFAQSSQWARVKAEWKSVVLAAEDEKGNIRGSLNILIRKTPLFGCSVMHSARGPVCEPHDRETVLALLDGAKKLAKEHKAYILRLEPDVRADDAEFCKILTEAGFRIRNKSKNFEGINPRFVYRKDIKGMNEDELIASFQPKCRYNVRLAERKGVVVKLGGREDIPEFHKVMWQTGQRDNFTVRPCSYFERMYDCMAPEHLRLYLAYYQEKLLAGIIVIRYGKKCWYLYGASSNEHRNTMPAYLLQSEAMKWAAQSGCEIYDFRGVSGDLSEDNPLYGIYRFKKGFSGELVELVGEADCIFNPLVYAAEKVGLGLLKRVARVKSKIGKKGRGE